MLPSVRSLLNDKYYISRQIRWQLLSEMRRQNDNTTILTEEKRLDFSKIDTLGFMRDLKALNQFIVTKVNIDSNGIICATRSDDIN
jgi:hypothetical protein